MIIQRFLAAMAILALVSAPVLAQMTPAPKSETPAKAAPKGAAKKKAATPDPAAVTAKVNLNTASAQELDTLPQIGPARAKAIIEARAKGQFKDWDDFVARKVVPANAQRAIMDRVTF